MMNPWRIDRLLHIHSMIDHVADDLDDRVDDRSPANRRLDSLQGMAPR
jgi:hypothetical protein